MRPDVASNVFGVSLVPKGTNVQDLTLTRVEPKGEFSDHADHYNHVFIFLEGKGEGWIGDASYDIGPGVIVRVPAGQRHGYRNTDDSNLVLLTINYFDT
jgi:mannose-6-phosphate isomerase-like protein (cupin superfamily)